MPSPHIKSKHPPHNLHTTKWGFQAQQKVDEISGEGNHYTAEYWEMDPRLGRRWNRDPLEDEFPWQAPYTIFDNNPINKIDPTGQSAGDPSTHTDKDGNVVAVYNDGDNSVYKHDGNTEETKKELSANYNKKTNTDAGGKKMGETQFWDEFINPGTKKPEGKILFNQDWGPLLNKLHTQAMDQDLVEIANNSKSSTETKTYQFDVKANKKYSPYGPMTGKKLNGKYATGRSAGNYLAGWNGRTGTYFGMSLSKFEYMNLAGAYQKKMYKGKSTAFDIIFKGKTFGPAPYYGEEPYSGRMILRGWNNGQ
jgi:hypothetical protein